jgi:hypothetical protein
LAVRLTITSKSFLELRGIKITKYLHKISTAFQDRTGFHIRLDIRLEVEAVELRDWKKGEGTLIQKFL